MDQSGLSKIAQRAGTFAGVRCLRLELGIALGFAMGCAWRWAGEEGFSDGFEDPVTFKIDFCRLQFPLLVTEAVGTHVDVFGRLYIAGLTDLSADIYFTEPYKSRQRGTNENTNGLIRQYLPKNKPLDHLTQAHADRIERRLNHRPRKCLGYLTPHEVFNDTRETPAVALRG